MCVYYVATAAVNRHTKNHNNAQWLDRINKLTVYNYTYILLKIFVDFLHCISSDLTTH